MASPSKERYLDLLKIKVRGWVRVRVHTQEQGLKRIASLDTAKGRRTKAF